MTDTTLLPCAHCGIELDAVRTPVGDGYWVHPLTEASGVNCPLDDHFINFNDAAGIAAWNRRDQWRPISEAKKDRTPYLMHIRADLVVYTGREDLDRFADLIAVMNHYGLADDGFDIGWSFAAPVGMGGFPDDWFDGFQCITPPAPVSGGK